MSRTWVVLGVSGLLLGSAAACAAGEGGPPQLMIPGPSETIGPVPRMIVDFPFQQAPAPMTEFATAPGPGADGSCLEGPPPGRLERLNAYRYAVRGWVADHCSLHRGGDCEKTHHLRQWLFYCPEEKYRWRLFCYPINPCCDPPLYTYFLDPYCGMGDVLKTAGCAEPACESCGEGKCHGRLLNLLGHLKRHPDGATVPAAWHEEAVVPGAEATMPGGNQYP